MHPGPLFMSFGRYFVGLYLVFLLVMYLGAVYLLFGWYCVACLICLLVYCRLDIVT